MYIKKILLIVVFLGILFLGSFSYFVCHTMFTPNTVFDSERVHLYITSQDSYNDVKEKIKPYLKDLSSFEALAYRKKYVTHIKPGHYIIRKGMTNNSIINTIRSKNIPVMVSFNNQETIADLAKHIASQLEADSLSLVSAMTDPTFLKDNNLTLGASLGVYIPNSYEFYWNTSAVQFRNKMIKEYQLFWNKNRLNKAQSIKLSPQQVITLASIVQKETSKVDERPRVAGVYINRLNKGIPLQADPTVIYAIKHKSGNFNQVIKRVLNKDLTLDSPYNTYKYNGLPPGPIAMPDISSIDAVLNYEKHNYYYFVASVSNFGYHKFAKTLNQHNQNRREYIKWINKMGVRR